ncbi:hypothetical protein KP509_14G032600 [Ceratopteris richardii]|uniref:Uncharacterized protein n=1 Tax=Ceratopteris richardii TaxID=49495 RepID=A0A8T2TBV7_CERRI|nr:hypothetical protein KP509_14G032600 [Ceratopteris richardii]
MDIVECVRGIDDCRDKSSATELRIVFAVAVILAACVIGVCMPMAGRYMPAFHADGNLFLVTKSFAARVYLATAYVHVHPDSFETLSNPCLSENRWAKSPFAGFISILARLFVLIIDASATMLYENKHQVISRFPINDKIPLPSSPEQSKDVKARRIVERSRFKVSSTMSIHADAGSQAREVRSHVSVATDDCAELRHRVIAHVLPLLYLSILHSSISNVMSMAVLELGIVAHSVIIGITVGTSESRCTIMPLLAALTFHQFRIEGIALGRCITQLVSNSRIGVNII